MSILYFSRLGKSLLHNCENSRFCKHAADKVWTAPYLAVVLSKNFAEAVIIGWKNYLWGVKMREIEIAVLLVHCNSIKGNKGGGLGFDCWVLLPVENDMNVGISVLPGL